MDIEILEEYEDLIMPATQPEAGKGRGDPHGVHCGEMRPVEDNISESSESVDMDIFDESSDEETNEATKRVLETVMQKRQQVPLPDDSEDSLEKLVRELAGDKRDDDAASSSLTSCLKKNNKSDKSDSSNPSQKHVAFAPLPSFIQSTPTTVTVQQSLNDQIMKRKSTIVKPEKIQFKDPAFDPLDLDDDNDVLNVLSDDSFVGTTEIADNQIFLSESSLSDITKCSTMPAFSTDDLPEKARVTSQAILAPVDIILLDSLKKSSLELENKKLTSLAMDDCENEKQQTEVVDSNVLPEISKTMEIPLEINENANIPSDEIIGAQNAVDGVVSEVEKPVKVPEFSIVHNDAKLDKPENIELEEKIFDSHATTTKASATTATVDKDNQSQSKEKQLIESQTVEEKHKPTAQKPLSETSSSATFKKSKTIETPNKKGLTISDASNEKVQTTKKQANSSVTPQERTISSTSNVLEVGGKQEQVEEPTTRKYEAVSSSTNVINAAEIATVSDTAAKKTDTNVAKIDTGKNKAQQVEESGSNISEAPSKKYSATASKLNESSKSKSNKIGADKSDANINKRKNSSVSEGSISEDVKTLQRSDSSNSFKKENEKDPAIKKDNVLKTATTSTMRIEENKNISLNIHENQKSNSSSSLKNENENNKKSTSNKKDEVQKSVPSNNLKEEASKNSPKNKKSIAQKLIPSSGKSVGEHKHTPIKKDEVEKQSSSSSVVASENKNNEKNKDIPNEKIEIRKSALTSSLKVAENKNNEDNKDTPNKKDQIRKSASTSSINSAENKNIKGNKDTPNKSDQIQKPTSSRSMKSAENKNNEGNKDTPNKSDQILKASSSSSVKAAENKKNDANKDTPNKKDKVQKSASTSSVKSAETKNNEDNKETPNKRFQAQKSASSSSIRTAENKKTDGSMETPNKKHQVQKSSSTSSVKESENKSAENSKDTPNKKDEVQKSASTNNMKAAENAIHECNKDTHKNYQAQKSASSGSLKCEGNKDTPNKKEQVRKSVSNTIKAERKNIEGKKDTPNEKDEVQKLGFASSLKDVDNKDTPNKKDQLQKSTITCSLKDVRNKDTLRQKEPKASSSSVNLKSESVRDIKQMEIASTSARTKVDGSNSTPSKVHHTGKSTMPGELINDGNKDPRKLKRSSSSSSLKSERNKDTTNEKNAAENMETKKSLMTPSSSNLKVVEETMSPSYKKDVWKMPASSSKIEQIKSGVENKAECKKAQTLSHKNQSDKQEDNVSEKILLNDSLPTNRKNESVKDEKTKTTRNENVKGNAAIPNKKLERKASSTSLKDNKKEEEAPKSLKTSSETKKAEDKPNKQERTKSLGQVETPKTKKSGEEFKNDAFNKQTNASNEKDAATPTNTKKADIIVQQRKSMPATKTKSDAVDGETVVKHKETTTTSTPAAKSKSQQQPYRKISEATTTSTATSVENEENQAKSKETTTPNDKNAAKEQNSKTITAMSAPKATTKAKESIVKKPVVVGNAGQTTTPITNPQPKTTSKNANPQTEQTVKTNKNEANQIQVNMTPIDLKSGQTDIKKGHTHVANTTSNDEKRLLRKRGVEADPIDAAKIPSSKPVFENTNSPACESAASEPIAKKTKEAEKTIPKETLQKTNVRASVVGKVNDKTEKVITKLSPETLAVEAAAFEKFTASEANKQKATAEIKTTTDKTKKVTPQTRATAEPTVMTFSEWLARKNTKNVEMSAQATTAPSETPKNTIENKLAKNTPKQADIAVVHADYVNIIKQGIETLSSSTASEDETIESQLRLRSSPRKFENDSTDKLIEKEKDKSATIKQSKRRSDIEILKELTVKPPTSSAVKTLFISQQHKPNTENQTPVNKDKDDENVDAGKTKKTTSIETKAAANPETSEKTGSVRVVENEMQPKAEATTVNDAAQSVKQRMPNEPAPDVSKPKRARSEIEVLKDSMPKDMRESGIDDLMRAHADSPRCLTKRSIATALAATSSPQTVPVLTTAASHGRRSIKSKRQNVSDTISQHSRSIRKRAKGTAVAVVVTSSGESVSKNVLTPKIDYDLHKCRKLRVRLNRSIVRKYFENLRKQAHVTTVTTAVKDGGRKRKSTQQLAIPSKRSAAFPIAVELKAAPIDSQISPMRQLRNAPNATLLNLPLPPIRRRKATPQAKLTPATITTGMVETQALTTTPTNTTPEAMQQLTTGDEMLLTPISVAPVQPQSPTPVITKGKRNRKKRGTNTSLTNALTAVIPSSSSSTSSAAVIQRQFGNRMTSAAPSQQQQPQTIPQPPVQVQALQQLSAQPPVVVAAEMPAVTPKREIIEDEYDTAAAASVSSLSVSTPILFTPVSQPPPPSPAEVQNTNYHLPSLPRVISGATSHSLPPAVIDNAGTRLYSYLHPTRYNANHGNVMLDYCCPNLDGPMTAIDPTRRHDKIDATVRELPAFISMETRLVTRSELEANSNSIPAAIRHKVQRMASGKSSTSTTGTNNSTNNEFSLTTVATMNASPIVTPISLSALQKQLPATTTLTAKTGPQAQRGGVKTTAAAAATTSSSAASTTPTAIIKPTSLEEMRAKNRIALKNFDAAIKKNYALVSMLSYAERQRLQESMINSTQLMPRDIEMATRVLQEYVTHMVIVTARATTTTSTATTSTPTITEAEISTSRAISSTFNTPTTTSPTTRAQAKRATKSSTTTLNTTTPASAPAPRLVRKTVPIYNSNRSIIGYQVQMLPETPSENVGSGGVGLSAKTASMPSLLTQNQTPISATTTGKRSGVFVIENIASSASAKSNTSSSSLNNTPKTAMTTYRNSRTMQTSTPNATPSAAAGSVVTRSGRGAVNERQQLSRSTTTTRLQPTPAQPIALSVASTASTSSLSKSLPGMPTLIRNPHLPPLQAGSSPASINRTTVNLRSTNYANQNVQGQSPSSSSTTRSARSSTQLIIVTHDQAGNPLPTAEESILPDDGCPRVNVIVGNNGSGRRCSNAHNIQHAAHIKSETVD